MSACTQLVTKICSRGLGPQKNQARPRLASKAAANPESQITYPTFSAAYLVGNGSAFLSFSADCSAGQGFFSLWPIPMGSRTFFVIVGQYSFSTFTPALAAMDKP